MVKRFGEYPETAKKVNSVSVDTAHAKVAELV